MTWRGVSCRGGVALSSALSREGGGPPRPGIAYAVAWRGVAWRGRQIGTESDLELEFVARPALSIAAGRA